MKKGDETKEKIKDVSLNLFHRKGYKHTSINDILDSSGVKKGNFYFHYPSKEKLIVDVLNKALSNYENQINSSIKHEAISDQIVDMIETIAAYHIGDGISKGCLFGNMALEIGHDGSEISSFVGNVFKRWEARFEKLFIAAVNSGELELKESAKVLSRMILALIEGGLVLSKISGNVDCFNDCKGFIISLIEERKTPRKAK